MLPVVAVNVVTTPATAYRFDPASTVSPSTVVKLAVVPSSVVNVAAVPTVSVGASLVIVASVDVNVVTTPATARRSLPASTVVASMVVIVPMPL